MKQKGFQCRVVVCVREIISDELHHPVLAQIDGVERRKIGVKMGSWGVTLDRS